MEISNQTSYSENQTEGVSKETYSGISPSLENETSSISEQEINETEIEIPEQPDEIVQEIEQAITRFIKTCDETCDLKQENLSKSNYTLKIEIDNSRLYLESFTYLLELSENLTTDSLNQTNITNYTVKQYPAKVGEMVKWEKIIELNETKLNESKDKEVEIEFEIEDFAEEILVEDEKGKKIIDVRDVDDIRNKFVEKKEPKEIGKLKNVTLKLKEKDTKKYNLTYETPPAEKFEENVSESKKIVNVSAPMKYKEIIVEVELPSPVKNKSAQVTWVNKDKIIPKENLTFIDEDNDSLYEKISWNVSGFLNETETFEIDLVILNPIEYLKDGDVWIVRFETIGTANLSIWSENAAFEEIQNDSNLTIDEMEFLNLSCGNKSLSERLVVLDEENNSYNYTEISFNDSIKPYKFFVEDYYCEDIGSFSNYMNIAGYAILEFEFANERYTLRERAIDPISAITWEDPTPDDGERINDDFVYLNTTIVSDEETSAWFDWNNSLVGYWSFDYSNSTGIFDNSSYSAFGEFVNGIGEENIIPGVRGNAIDLSSDTGYIDLGNPSYMNFTHSNATFSVSFWMKKNSNTTNSVPLGHVAGGVAGWMFYGVNSLGFYVYDYEDDSVYMEVPINKWIHVVGVSNDTHSCIYQNGVLKDCDAKGAGAPLPDNDNLLIGTYYITQDPNYNGSIDEVMIFNISLSSQEIKALYNNTANRLYNNFTDLDYGDYNYSVYAIDESGNLNITDDREVTTSEGSQCGTISAANQVYTLQNNVTSTGTCFTLAANNITLDCNGYWINYSTGGAQSTYGIYSSGYENHTIRNCYLTDGNNASAKNYRTAISMVSVNNTIIENNYIQTYGPWLRGISFSLYNKGMIVRNNIINLSGDSGYGVQFGGSKESGNLTFFNNSIYTYGESVPGIYSANMDTSGGNPIPSNFSFNKIFTYGHNSFGIYVYVSSNSTFSNNDVFSDSSYGYYSVVSHNNTFYSNNFSGFYGGYLSRSKMNYFYDNLFNSSSNYGIYLYDSSENIFMRNNYFTSGSYAIYFSSSNYTNFTDCVSVSSGNTDVYVTSDSGSIENYFTNCSYDSEDVNGAGNWISRQWYYQSYVNDTDGNALENANVSVYNSSGVLAFTELVNGSGWISRYNLTEYINTGGTRVYQNNYLIHANLSGYNNQTEQYNLSVEQNNLNDYFTLSETSECLYMDTDNQVYTLQNNVSDIDTCFSVVADNVTIDCNGYWINYSYGGGNYEHGVVGSGVDNLTVKNCNFIDGNWTTTNAGRAALYFSGTNNSLALNNTFDVNITYGILLNNRANNNTLTNNTAKSWSGIAIYILSSDNNTLINNFGNSTLNTGLGLSSADNCTLRNNTGMSASSSDYGLSISNSEDGYFINNTGMNNIYRGGLVSGDRNNLTENNWSTTGGSISIIVTGHNNTFINNTAYGGSGHGFYITGESNTFKDNTGKSSSQRGFVFASSHNGTYINNTARSDSNIAWYIDSSENNTLASNFVESQSSSGFYIEDRSSHNTLLGNNVSSYGNAVGIYILYKSTNNTLINNYGSSGGTAYGIALSSGSDDNILINNTARSASNRGLQVFNSSNNVIIGLNSSGVRALNIGNSNYTNVSDCLYLSGSSADVYVEGDFYATGNILVNCSYDLGEETVTGSNSEISRQWYYQTYVNDSNGNALENVNVSVYNSSNMLAFTELTDATGFISRKNLTEYINTGGTRSYHNNFTIFVNLSGTNNASDMNYNLSIQENNLEDYFELEDTLDCGTLSDSNTVYTLTKNVTSSGTCFTISAENVTLDCNDYWINYGAEGSSGYGISASSDGVYVKNCNVIDGNFSGSTGRRGIVYANLNHGIIENTFVNVSKSFGIRVEGSTNITLTNNTAYTYSDNTEGIYLVNLHNSYLENNTGISKGDSGYFISSSSNNTFVNLIGESISSNYGFYLTNVSYSTFIDCYGNGSGNWAGFRLTDWSHDNTFIRPSAFATYGFWIKQSNDTILQDCVDIESSSFDVNIQSDDFSLRTTLINCSIDSSGVGGSNNLINQWYYQSYVNLSNGTLVSGANVSFYNSSGVLAFTEPTNSSGWISKQNLTEYVNYGGTRSYYNNYLININDSTYGNKTEQYNLSVDLNNLNDYFEFDIDYPLISFENPTSEDEETINDSFIYVNVSSSDSGRGNNNLSVFINFNDSVLGWWRMDDVNYSGYGAEVYDYFGNYNGTAQGNAIPILDGIFGGGISYSGTQGAGGSGGCVVLPDIDTPDEVTLSIWYKPRTVSSSASVIQKNPGGCGDPFEIYTSTNQVAWRIYNETNDCVTYYSGAVLTVGEWTHIATTYNGTLMKIYIDGVEVLSEPNTGKMNLNDYPISVGSAVFSNGTCSSWFNNGTADDFIIFNRSLSLGEIQGLYANTSSKYLEHNFTSLSEANYTIKAYSQDMSGNVNSTEDRTIRLTLPASIFDPDENLIGHWTFDEGDATFGTTIVDESVNGNDGSIAESQMWSIDGIIGSSALYGNDSAGYVLVPYDSSLNSQNITISAWLYNNDSSTDTYAYIRRVGEWHIRRSSGYWDFDGEGSWNPGLINPQEYSFASNQNQWHLHTLVIDMNAQEVRFYVDGEQIGGNESFTTAASSTTNSLYLGRFSSGYRWNGGMDDYRLYNYSMSGNDVYNLFEYNTQYLAPRYSYTSTNNSFAGQITKFLTKVEDFNLYPNGTYIFSTNNTGEWVNDSEVNFTANLDYTDSVRTLNSTVGNFVSFRWYLWDNAGNITTTKIYNLTVLEADATSPTITFESPTPDNDSYTNSDVNIVANISDLYDTSSFIDFDNSLLLWLPMEGNSLDYSSYNWSVTDGGVTYGDGIRGHGAEDFTSSADLTIDSDLDYASTNMTIAFWMYVESNAIPSRQNPLGKAYGGDGTFTLERSGSISFFFGSSGANDQNYTSDSSGDIAENGTWAHWVITRDRTNRITQWYKNGQASGSPYQYSYIYDPVHSTNALSIGDDYVNPLNGTLDEVMIFNRTLTQEEVLALYSSQTNKFNVSFEDLDEGQHDYVVYAVDKYGNQNSSERNFIVDSTWPQITWENPTPDPGETVTEDFVYLNATITDSSETSAWFDWNRSLVGYWSFDYYNSTHVFDNSSYGILGEFGGNDFGTSNLTNAVRGKGVDFDASDDIITISNADNLQSFTEITLATWIKFRGLDYSGGNGTLNTFAKKGHPDSLDPHSGFWFSYDNRNNEGKFTYLCFGDTEGGYSGGENNFGDPEYQYTFENDVWYHLAITIDSDEQAKLFINGSQHGSTKQFSNLNLSNVDSVLELGEFSVHDFNGSMDEFMIFNRSFSEQEILALYNNTANRLYNNFTDLQGGNYTYNIYTIDSSGNLNITDEREVKFEATPKIYDIMDVSDVDLTLGPSATYVIVNFSVSDENGATDLDDSTAMINLTQSGEETRFSEISGCTKYESSGVYANYTCNVTMWWFDGDGVWNIYANISDGQGNNAGNLTQTLTVKTLTGFEISPSSLDFSELTPGDTNITPINYILMNNTGNQEIISGNVQINASDLRGEDSPGYSLWAGNFSASPNSGVDSCDIGAGSATQLVNFTNVNIAGISIPVGNYTKSDSTGQEEMYFCLRKVGWDLTEQRYSTNNLGAWTIRILMVALAFRRKRKKDKERNYVIPISIFNKKLGALETLSKYMKENLGLSYHDIAEILKRDDRTIWTACKKANEKQEGKIENRDVGKEIYLPMEIFENRDFTPLESIINYLKVKGMKYSEIGRLLDRDERNIWTVYNRMKKKFSTESLESKVEDISFDGLPTSIFNKELGTLESISKYMKENLGMSYKEIANELNRDQRTIWSSYHKAIEKKKDKFELEKDKVYGYIDLNIFRDRNFTPLESIINYLKVKGMKYSEIGRLLDRDERNIWTVYNRIFKKKKQ